MPEVVSLRPAARDLLKIFFSNPQGKSQTFLVQDKDGNWFVRGVRNGKRLEDLMLNDEQQVIADAVLKGGYIEECNGRCCEGAAKFMLTKKGEEARKRR